MPARPQLGVSFCKNKLKTSQTWLILAVSAAESSQDVYGRPPRSKGYIKMINTMNTRNNIPNIWSHDLLHKVIHDLLHNGMAGWVWRGWIVWAGWCVWAGRSRKTCLYGQEVRCISFQLSAASSATPSKAPAEVYTSPLVEGSSCSIDFSMAFQLNSIAFPLLQNPSHVCLNAVSYQITWQAKYMYRILHRIFKATLSNTIASLVFDGMQVLQDYFIIAFPNVEGSNCSLHFP